jgi:C4-dicarboxylate-specific signal transduction histidine kinase
VDLNRLIAQSIRVLQACSALEGVEVRVSAAAHLPPVPGNWDQLQHVFVNLILAAGDALQAAPAPARALRIETAHPTAAVVRAVIRTAAHDARMTTQDGARGIGVRLAHSIVAAHGGEMRADLHPEGGMSYHLELPVVSRRA